MTSKDAPFSELGPVRIEIFRHTTVIVACVNVCVGEEEEEEEDEDELNGQA